MSSVPTITDATFAAFLRCETKAYLLREGACGTSSGLAPWQLSLTRAFKQLASERLRSTVHKNECFVGTPSPRTLERGLYRIILDPLIASSDVRSQLDALWRFSSESNASKVLYGPIRFVRREKPSITDKLMLAFDAIVIARATGRMPPSGKLIYGSQFVSVTVPLAKLLKSAGSSLTKAVSQANSTPPPPVLNKHCPECEFQARCRRVAVETDDLSLLVNMTAKERKKHNDKGIFTVTQLSYRFRPRRRRRFEASQVKKARTCPEGSRDTERLCPRCRHPEVCCA